MQPRISKRIEVDGKFFRCGGRRFFLKAVTYGPFPEPQPEHGAELQRVRAAGFNAIRVYTEPSRELLDAALAAGLWVFVGLEWQWNRVFLGFRDGVFFEQAKESLRRSLESWGEHPAVAGCYVANEVKPDLARWMGAEEVRGALEELIDLAQQLCPHLLVAYASYPSSEYLEPINADFTAMNVYLEKVDDYQRYLRRLHHLAGDRPVVIAEFGVDSESHGEEEQARLLEWSLLTAQSEGLAGWTCFAWSDQWFNNGQAIDGWSFGLVDRAGVAKHALGVVAKDWQPQFTMPMISVIICVYNGASRIGDALRSLEHLEYPHYEVIVVDDGSTDGTAEVIAQYPFAKLVRGAHQGLSVARNLGAAAAVGEILSYTDDDCMVDGQYLFWLAKAYAENDWGACGGPNIPPLAEGEDEAVVACAPGAPSHVMLDDVEAEHLPGCHLSVRKEAFEDIGGFRAQYRAAGDDVDFCWRLREAGYKMGFHGASFVWHRRRTSLARYFMQQRGYGKAEALLMRDHPEKFRRGSGARWEGCVYSGAARGADRDAVIYHGPVGLAGYQIFWNVVMPTRLLAKDFDDHRARLKLALTQVLQPVLRRFARWHYGRAWAATVPRAEKVQREALAKVKVLEVEEMTLPLSGEDARAGVLEYLLENGWELAGDYEEWDLQCDDGGRLMLLSEWIGRDCFRLRVRAAGMGAGFARFERELLAAHIKMFA